MRPPKPPFARLSAVARSTRAWLAWLALALALAHSVGAWHPYSHSVDEAADLSSFKHAGGAACGICVAVAAMGSGPAAQPTLHLHHFTQAAPVFDLPFEQRSPQRRPYAIRAPPVLTA